MNWNILVQQLESNIRSNIENLKKIVDVLSVEYRGACDIIDDTIDHRKKYLDQLLELDETLSRLVTTHPVMNVEKIWGNALDAIKDLAACTTHSQ